MALKWMVILYYVIDKQLIEVFGDLGMGIANSILGCEKTTSFFAEMGTFLFAEKYTLLFTDYSLHVKPRLFFGCWTSVPGWDEVFLLFFPLQFCFLTFSDPPVDFLIIMKSTEVQIFSGKEVMITELFLLVERVSG